MSVCEHHDIIMVSQRSASCRTAGQYQKLTIPIIKECSKVSVYPFSDTVTEPIIYRSACSKEINVVLRLTLAIWIVALIELHALPYFDAFPHVSTWYSISAFSTGLRLRPGLVGEERASMFQFVRS